MKNIIVSIILLLSVSFSATASQMQGHWHRGSGSFAFTEYEPLADKPVTVYFHIPTEGDISQMRVLFVMHGAERSGSVCMDNWKDLAEKHGFIVIAPEFSKKYYKENDYQFGGVMQKKGSDKTRPSEKWTYNIIEAIFDLFKEQTGSTAEYYDMQGHSAGGQFTHRYLMAMPQARVATAVASNPGSWTFLLPEGLAAPSGKKYGWPYSVMGTPMADTAYIKTFLARRLFVHLGTSDRATSGTYVPTDEAALAQGKYRFDRGKNFYKQARRLARKNGWEFGWRKVHVKGISHTGKGMIYGKSDIDADGNPVFDTENISPNGAFSILYK